MSLFEFLMVLVSLIVGLGITELLTGIARAVRSRGELKTYWVHTIWIAIGFLALLQQWWEIWGLREIELWRFQALVLMISGPVGLFIIAHLLFPESLDGADLRAYYYEEMQPVFILAIGVVIASTAFRPVVTGAELLALDNLSSLVMIVVFAVMRAIQVPGFHGAMVCFILFAQCADILLWSPEIS